MARKLHSRLRIKGALVAETALHVGGHGESPDTDLPLARNGAGDFYIPGTSIAGVLRAWFEKSFRNRQDKTTVDAMVTDLFGFQEAENGHASFVIVEDIKLPGATESEIRDGVGIDRFYGTAANQAKFDRAVLTRGTKLDLAITVEISMEVEQRAQSAKVKSLFLHLLEAMQNGELRLGGSRTRGLGKVKLDSIKIKEESLVGFGILDSLENKVAEEELRTFQTDFLEAADAKESYDDLKDNLSGRLLKVRIKWQPRSTLMVKAGCDGIGVDTLPLTSGLGNGKVSLCLPGSSIKGAFRSHAERILRTLYDCENTKDAYRTRDKKFHEQIKLQLINALFGAKKEADKLNQPLSTYGLGAVSVDDCYTEQSWDQETWQNVARGKVTETATTPKRKSEVEVSYNKQELWQALRRIDLSKQAAATLTEAERLGDTENFRISHHVAIDRWTGGASDGALYSVLQPTSLIKWNDIYLALDVSRLNDGIVSPALMLLLLVMRDFAENRLPLGFATNRGMGDVAVAKIELTGLYNIVWENGKFNFKDDEQVADENERPSIKIQKEWNEWINLNQTPSS